MSDVYISYAREQRPRAELLARALEESGISVWWDKQILAGESLAILIEKELDRASCVIVLWSADSRRSDWVREEAAYARDMKKLISVVIEDVLPPISFRAIQSAVLTDWSGEQSNPNFRRLVEAVSILVERSGGQRGK